MDRILETQGTGDAAILNKTQNAAVTKCWIKYCSVQGQLHFQLDTSVLIWSKSFLDNAIIELIRREEKKRVAVMTIESKDWV